MRELLAYLVAIGGVLVLIPILGRVASRIGLVDRPGGRKEHEGAIPLVGGLAMFIAFMFALLLLPLPMGGLRAYLAGAALLVLVGVLDDLHELSSTTRFAAQIGAALLMVFWGEVRLTDFGDLVGHGSVVELGAWSVPLTVFAVVGVINAVNMIDGLDGLAGLLCLICAGFMAWGATAAGVVDAGSVLIVLLLVLSGYLVFNLRHPWRARAAVFMGDAGSMFLGYTLAWFLVSLSQGEDRVFAPVVALWLLALPLVDTVSLMLRRGLRGRSPFAADREHLHHAMLAMGLGINGVVTAMVALGLLLSALGWGLARAGVPQYGLFYGFLALFTAYTWLMARGWAAGRLLGQKLRRTSTEESA